MESEELINYCALHCQTERALFSREHIVEMFRLAGATEAELPTHLPDWTSWPYKDMMPLVSKARERLASPKAPAVEAAQKENP